jgi:hypothetical protein
MAMSFGGALEHMKSGGTCYRENKGKDVWIGILEPGTNSKMTEQYIYIHYSDGSKVPWCPRHGDLLANDWIKIAKS